MKHYLAFVLMLCMLVACGVEPTPTPDAVATQIAVEDAAHATMTAKAPATTNTPTATATYTRRPTDTATPIPTPTRTLTPSVTPTPSNTPTPVPTDTSTPTPTPIIIAGKGQTATNEFIPPASVSIVHLTHKGTRNFIVQAYQGGDTVLLVNVIGTYSGDRPLWGDEPVVFDVDADGAWTIELRPAAVADSAIFWGTGDAVSGIFGPPEDGAWEIYHKGESNFIVYLHCAGGSNLIQNQIGPVEGSTMVQFAEGPCLWEVQADGEWGLKPRGAPAWPTSTPKPTTEPKPAAKPQATKPPTPTPVLAKIGEQVKAGNWLFTVTEVQWYKALYLYDSAEVAMGVYCVIFADIQNKAPGTTHFGELLWELHGAGGNVYDDDSATFRAAWQFGGKDTAWDDLNPGQTAQIVMAFDVAKEAKGLQLYSYKLKQPFVYIGDAQPPQDQ